MLYQWHSKFLMAKMKFFQRDGGRYNYWSMNSIDHHGHRGGYAGQVEAIGKRTSENLLLKRASFRVPSMFMSTRTDRMD